MDKVNLVVYQSKSRRKSGETEKWNKNGGGAADKGSSHLAGVDFIDENLKENADKAKESKVDEEGPVGEAVGKDEGREGCGGDPGQREVERLGGREDWREILTRRAGWMGQDITW